MSILNMYSLNTTVDTKQTSIIDQIQTSQKRCFFQVYFNQVKIQMQNKHQLLTQSRCLGKDIFCMSILNMYSLNTTVDTKQTSNY